MSGQIQDDTQLRLAEAERRLGNVLRVGKVVKTDPKKGMIKVQYATGEDGKPVTTPWVPWKTRSGDIKDWNPPSKDEQVTIFSPSGEIGQHSWADSGGFSNQNKQPHDKDAERVITIGGTVITIKDGEVRIKSDKIVLEGKTYLGGDGGQKVHRRGDMDSDNDYAMGSASKVWAV